MTAETGVLCFAGRGIGHRQEDRRVPEGEKAPAHPASSLTSAQWNPSQMSASGTVRS